MIAEKQKKGEGKNKMPIKLLIKQFTSDGLVTIDFNQ
jgi:hypothetical protein